MRRHLGEEPCPDYPTYPTPAAARIAPCTVSNLVRWGFCTTRSPLTACRRRVAPPCSAKPPTRTPRRVPHPTVKLGKQTKMTDIPTADVATAVMPTADMPTADAQNSGRSRHRGTATTTNAHGGAAEPQHPRSSRAPPPGTRNRAQASGTKATPGAKHRLQPPNRLTLHAATCRLAGSHANTKRPTSPDFAASARPH